MFLQERRMELKYVARVVQLMFSIPANTGWIERAYSLFEMICTKRRNRLDVDHIRHEFFLNVLKRKVRDCMGYDEEIKLASEKRTFPEF